VVSLGELGRLERESEAWKHDPELWAKHVAWMARQYEALADYFGKLDTTSPLTQSLASALIAEVSGLHEW
jgi:rhamnogalacturonyl hydrolase YesR